MSSWFRRLAWKGLCRAGQSGLSCPDHMSGNEDAKTQEHRKQQVEVSEAGLQVHTMRHFISILEPHGLMTYGDAKLVMARLVPVSCYSTGGLLLECFANTSRTGVTLETMAQLGNTESRGQRKVHSSQPEDHITRQLRSGR